MQVALEERKNIAQEEVRNPRFRDDADIPAGLDRLDLILEADAKRNTDAVADREEVRNLRFRLDNIDAIIAYILNVLDDLDLDYDDPDPLAAEALGDEDIDDPLADDHPDFEDPDAAADVHVPDHLNDDPHADIDIPPPGEDDPDIPEGLDVNVEHWRIIDDFPDYEVSNHGRVRDTLSRTIREPTINTNGYKILGLRGFGEVPVGRRVVYVHRLVAKTWIPNPENKPQVDHRDGDRGNNFVGNLRWATRAENMQNRRMFRNNTTGYKGVSRARGGGFRARITANKRHIYLGLFATEEEAAAAYRAAALVHHRAYANPWGR